MTREVWGSLVVAVGLVAGNSAAHDSQQHAHHHDEAPVEHGAARAAHDMAESARAVEAAFAGMPVQLPLPATLHYELNAPHRTVADFFPRIMTERQGATLSLLELSGRRAVHELLRAGLSGEGYALVQQVMALEDHLRAIGGYPVSRDPGNYGVHLFGTPGGAAPWGWKVEGHHLSLNFTLDGDAVRSTPVFVGVNPAEIRRGPLAGFRTLAEQDDLALALLRSLTPEQRAVAVAEADPPNEIVPRGGAITTADALGLSAADMTDAQRHMLHDLLASYARLLRPELGTAAMQRALDAGWEHLHFRWRGGETLHERHYYRIEGPTVIVEFDRIANAGEQDANHIHAIWHDPERDYGRDLLAEHHAAHHGLHPEGHHDTTHAAHRNGHQPQPGHAHESKRAAAAGHDAVRQGADADAHEESRPGAGDEGTPSD